MFLPIINLLRADGSIVVNKTLAKNIGINEAIVYAELAAKFIYYAEKNRLTEDGYFFSTVEDLEESTTLSRYQQNKAIEKLVKLNLIQKDIRKVGEAPKRFFRLNPNIEVLLPFLAGKADKKLKNLTNAGFVRNSQIEKQETRKSICKKLAPNNTNINNTNIIDSTTTTTNNISTDLDKRAEEKPVVVDNPSIEKIKEIQETIKKEGLNLTPKNIQELYWITSGDKEQIINGVLSAIQYSKKAEVKNMWGLIKNSVETGKLPAVFGKYFSMHCGN